MRRRENAEIGVFITLGKPSREVELEATTVLFILSPYQQAERIPDKKAAEQSELFG